MRIAIVSDIHGNLAALEAVVSDIAHKGVDAIVNLGNSLSAPLLPKETAQYLMAQQWTHWAGNHERQLLDVKDNSGESDKYARAQLSSVELDWIANFNIAEQWNADVLLCHGTPTSDVVTLLQVADMEADSKQINESLGEVSANLILCGHSHVARSVRTASGKVIVNPGSVGQPAYRDYFPHPQVIQSGSPDARYAIAENHNSERSSMLISVPYPHHQMVQLANLRQRQDWAHALETGYAL